MFTDDNFIDYWLYLVILVLNSRLFQFQILGYFWNSPCNDCFRLVVVIFVSMGVFSLGG